MFAFVSFSLLFLTFSTATKVKRCSTLSCVYASAEIITKIKVTVDPCEDFYEFACGEFKEVQHTPDDKTTVDTISLMGDKLTEFLLTLLEQPSKETDSRLHTLARKFYSSCMDSKTVDQKGKHPVLNLLDFMGKWPILEGKNWDESLWDWERTILQLRKYINKNDENIFGSKKESSNEIDTKNKRFNDEEGDLVRVEKSLKTLIESVVGILNSKHASTIAVLQEIDDLLEFEKKLDEHQQKFKVFRKVFDKQIRDKNSGFIKVPELLKFYKYVLYVDLIEPFLLSNASIPAAHELSLDFNVKFYEFLKKTPKRTLANYIGWRTIQGSLSFLDSELREAVLNFQKDAFGKEDDEQRWIFCANIVTKTAPVAIGHLYTSYYFTEKDKANADELVSFILQEYIDTLKNSEWMDEKTKQIALEKTNKMKKFIGYHVKLRSAEAEMFYDDLPVITSDNFLEMGLSFSILSSDREFYRLHAKKKQGDSDDDWTKYSKPATINAFYNSRDNSIQFPAAILQSPNFDKDRPIYMNFGAIGSIIGHEMTHAFDDQSSKLETWSDASVKAYQERVQCIVDQYSSYRVKEVEEFLRNENVVEFFINGNFTQKENIADCGGLKLAYKAYKRYESSNPESYVVPIGLQKYNPEKIFWLSFAQTYCSVERPAKMKNKVETDNHALDRFRVIGPLSNLKEFAETWSCPDNSPMNPKNKCALW